MECGMRKTVHPHACSYAQQTGNPMGFMISFQGGNPQIWFDMNYHIVLPERILHSQNYTTR